MKAPDKIYGKIVQNVILDCAIQNNGGFEYIRKGALLEWLGKKIELSYGQKVDAFVEVIDKINSL